MPYDNRLKGSLFKNDRKRDDKDPGYTGSCEMEDGKQFWVSAWLKESGPQSKNPGQKFFSLAFTAKDAPKQAAPQQQSPVQQAKPTPAAQPKPAPKQIDLDEDTPF